MMRIISPVQVNGSHVGAVAFVCANMARSITRAFPDSKTYVFSSGGKVARLWRSISLVWRMLWWLCCGDTIVWMYPTILLYPAMSYLKYWVASAAYGLIWFLHKHTRGKLALVILDMPKEQEESFGLKRIRISYDRFLRFENRLLTSVDKIVYCSRGFQELVDARGLSLTEDVAVCAIGYAEKKNIERSNTITRVFYSGELTREYEKNKLLEICNVLTDQEELVVCGRNGAWLNELNNPHVCYKGYVDARTHDAIAAQCDFGLIVYPDSGYYQYVTPSKLNAYVSMGLPALAIANRTLRDVFANYRVGQCVEEEEFLTVFKQWCSDKTYRAYQAYYDAEDYYARYVCDIQKALA